MSCGRRPPPPPGFGAAAGPPRTDFGGSKSAIRTNTMVIIETETDNGNLEVLQQSRVQNEAMASQSICQTSSLAGNKNERPMKGPYKRSRVDAVASPGVNARNTGQQLHPCKKSKGLGKLDNQGATELSRPPTPINLFEDECVFCHSFRTSENFHGPMVLYRDGRIVSSDEGNPTKTIYVHKKCMDWAPQVFFNGDKFVNMEKEIGRAEGKKCSRCKLPGAALRCYVRSCINNYHVPCAVMIPECSWDLENRHVWCPKHASNTLPSAVMPNHASNTLPSDVMPNCASNTLPSDLMPSHAFNTLPSVVMSSPIVESNITSLIVQNQYLVKQERCVIQGWEDQQVNQPNILSSSSLPQGQCSDKEGISAHYQSEEKHTNQSGTPVNQWVLLGSVFSASEKGSLKEFASMTSSTLAEEWDNSVTHVIVGRNAGTACGRSYEVLMAILSGKWVVTARWIVDCLAGPIPGPKTCLAEPITIPEIFYEVQFFDASRTSIGGPKRGRAGEAKGAPKLFSELYFCPSANLNPEYRENIKTLIGAAGGQTLEAMSPRSLQENLDKNPAKAYFIYEGGDEDEGIKYAASGAGVISHLWLFDAIASYDTRMLEYSYRCTLDMYAKTSREFHGPMVLYRDGRIVSSDEGNPTKTIYVHKKCMDWAPKVFFNGDKFANMEKEISRAKTKKCSRCKLPGAALRCYVGSCINHYHVPCAVMIPECSWDVENRHVWCPKNASNTLPSDVITNHASDTVPSDEMPNHASNTLPSDVMPNHAFNTLPSDVMSSPIVESNITSLIVQKWEDQQVNQPNISSSSSLPQGQCSDKEGTSAHYQREEKHTNRSGTPVNQWVLLGSVLSASEKDSLKEFASLTSSTLAEEWDKSVTHVIVGRSAGTACGRSYEVLMAILSGKWVVTARWIVDCLAGPIPGPKTCLAEPIIVPEISYEVEFFDASRTLIGGPKRGRTGAAKRAPKLFSELYFCPSAYLNPEYRENIKALIAAAGGQTLEAMSPRSLQENLDKNPAKAYFIYDGGDEDEGIKYAASGAQVISHLWLFDAIASYDARMLEYSYRCTLDMYAKTSREA